MNQSSTLFRKRQIKWKIVSNFVAFFEKLEQEKLDGFGILLEFFNNSTAVCFCDKVSTFPVIINRWNWILEYFLNNSEIILDKFQKHAKRIPKEFRNHLSSLAGLEFDYYLIIWQIFRSSYQNKQMASEFLKNLKMIPKPFEFFS